MKVTYIIAVLLLLNETLAPSQNTQVFSGCATDQLMYNNAVLRQAQNTIDAEAYKYFTSGKRNSLRGTIIGTIPVVVHIIHNGGAENISDAQVQTAIANINT